MPTQLEGHILAPVVGLGWGPFRAAGGFQWSAGLLSQPGHEYCGLQTVTTL